MEGKSWQDIRWQGEIIITGGACRQILDRGQDESFLFLSTGNFLLLDKLIVDCCKKKGVVKGVKKQYFLLWREFPFTRLLTVAKERGR